MRTDEQPAREGQPPNVMVPPREGQHANVLVPVPVPVVLNNSGTWRFGLCECCDDCESCLITCCVPCVTAGQIWDQGLDKSFIAGCLLYALVYFLPMIIGHVVYLTTGIPAVTNGFLILVFLYPWLWTGPLREKFGIEGSYCRDCCLYCWCSCCQMIRERREVMWNNDQRLRKDPVPVEAAPTAMI